MLESLAEWMSYPLYYAFDGAPPPPRTGAAHATIYPYGPFPTGDGKTVMLGLQNEREWVQFCDKVLHATGARQGRALHRQCQARGRARRAAGADRRDLRAAERRRRWWSGSKARRSPMPNARHGRRVAAPATEGARALARGRASPAGPVPALLPPGTWDDGDPRMDPVPALGEHTDAILGELGLDAAAIAALRAAKAI